MYIYTWPLSFSGVWMPFVVAPLVVYLAFILASGSVGDVDDLPHLELVPTGLAIVTGQK